MLGNEKFFHFVDEFFTFKNLLVGHLAWTQKNGGRRGRTLFSSGW